MSRILICAIVISAAAIPIYASDLRVIQRDVLEIANGYQVTVGVDFAGSPEAVSAWQLACQITPGDLTISVSPPDNYLFSDSESSALGCSWDEQTQSTLFYDYGWPPPSPLSGSNLVRIDLTSNSAEPFDFDFVFLPYNGETRVAHTG